MKRSPSRYRKIPKMDKFPQKSVHIFELSTTVIKVDIKVGDASLTQNQCFQYVTPPTLNACWDTATYSATPLNWTELNWIMTAWSSPATSTTKQNRIYQFFQKKFNQRRLQFLFTYSFSKWLAVLCFSFWKAFVKCPYLSVHGIFDDVRYVVISA